MTDLQMLEAFVLDNHDLEELEALAVRFNIFEALGVVRAERKHSNFLGFVLDPAANHGLGDRFLKKFLQSALRGCSLEVKLSPLSIDLLDLSGAAVAIERNSIDILVVDAKNKLCVIIENKVDSSQHSDQLSRYYRRVSSDFPDYAVFGVYLTLAEEASLHPQYVSFSHMRVRRILESLLANARLRIESDVRFALKQYTEVLGRHFMADEAIEKLCKNIYKQHKQALDLIFANLPNLRGVLNEHLQILVRDAGFELDDCSAAYVRFAVPAIDFNHLKVGKNWTSTKRLVLFELNITKTKVVLIIQMGPGDTDTRAEVHKLVLANLKTMKTEKTLSPEWQQLYRKVMIENLHDGMDLEDISEVISAKWQEFLAHDLPRIQDAFKNTGWS